jgi:hypothetical protein
MNKKYIQVNRLQAEASSTNANHAAQIAAVESRCNERIRHIQDAHKSLLDSRDLFHKDAIESLTKLHQEELESWRRREADGEAIGKINAEVQASSR